MIESKKIDNETSFKARFRQLVGDTARHEEIANKVNASRQNVGNWLNGNSMPNAAALIEISRAYNVSVDWLLGISNTQTVDKDVKFVQDCTGLSEKSVLTLINKIGKAEDSVDDLALSIETIKKAQHDDLVSAISLLIEEYADNYHDTLYGSADSVLRGVIEFLKFRPADNEQHEFILNQGAEILKISTNSAAADFISLDPSYVSSIDAQSLIDTILIDKIKKALTNIRAKQSK